MRIPPPSIILILSLGSVDALLTLIAVLAIGFGILSETDQAQVWITTLFAFAGVLGAAHVVLKVASLVGLYLARRWAVIAGALAFAVSWPVFLAVSVWFSPEAKLGEAAALTTAFFLACTLPHWARMTWRFP